MASKQFSLEPGLSNLIETGKSSNPSVSQVLETSKKDLEDLFHNFYDEYFDASKIMKSSTTIVESSNVKVPLHEEEVFHESSESFQEESSSSSLNDDVQQSLKEVRVPLSNTQSVLNNIVPNVDEASTSHNVFNERLEDAYFDASISFHDPSNVHTFYQPYPHEKNAMQEELDQFARLKVWRLVPRPEGKIIIKTKWIFKNKKDESSLVIRNKARLVAVVSTPMVEQAKLKVDLVGKPVDHTDYRSMIGSLMYVTSSRPDIMFATCMCARYQANPNEHHVSAVKRIFRYLKETINLGLWNPKATGFDLTAYSDADHAGCHLDRKSTSGSVQFLGDKLVCWSSKKQNYVSISTADAEYVACDSKSAIAISCNPVQYARTKHIDVRTGIDLPRSLHSNLGKLGLGDGVRECSSCGALYTAEYCCSNGSLVDKIICDPNKAPDFPYLHALSSNKFHCFHCKDELGDGKVCKRCTCTRCGSGLCKGICLICKQHFLNTSPSISSNSSQSPPQISKHCCYGCGYLLEEPFNHHTINELPPNVQSFDPKSDLVYSPPNVFIPSLQPLDYSYEFCGNDAYYGPDCSLQVPFTYDPEPCYNHDFNFSQNYSYDSYGNDSHFGYACQSQFPLNYALEPGYIENYNSYPYDSSSVSQQYPCCTRCGGPHETYQCEHSIFDEPCCKHCGGPHMNFQCQPMNQNSYNSNSLGFDQPQPPHEPVDSLSMGDEHLNTILATKSDESIKSSVENLVPNPSEPEGKTGCDLLACFTTFSNVLFNADYEFDYVNDQSLHNEDFPKKIFSNPLFEEEIISIKKDTHHFNAESDLVESMINRDSSIISSSLRIDSLLDEFAGELTLLKSIPPRIDETDYHPKNEIRFTERLLYDNSSPRSPKEFNSENSNADVESFSPSPIPIKDSNSHMEEINLSFNPDDPMPPSIEDDDNDSEGDNLFLERLLHDDPIPIPDTLDFSNVVRVFLPFFTYLVTSSILLSSGSEDTIFDPGITINHFYSFLAGFISSVWNFQEIQYSP
nr:hypothetical protein [Tanacetum cinerariifolium]